MNKEDIVMNYIEASTYHGEATEEGNFSVANREYKKLEKTYKQILQLGDDGLKILIKLTSHDKEYVRLWSATHTLAISEEVAKETLLELSTKPNLLGISAQTTLKEWENGNLSF